jgi:hypothetical protein
MLVLFPFSHRDFDAAKKLAQWVAELDPQMPSHQALLVASSQVTEAQVRELHAILRPAFGVVHAMRQNSPDESGWPKACNALFRTGAAYVRERLKTFFFWCEPDCIPLRSGWLNALEEEYRRAHKPFMGVVWDKPFRHMSGCAVYPHNIEAHNPAMLQFSVEPWDCVRPELVLPKCHSTNLLMHEWGDVATNTPWTFPDAQSLERIRPEAVLFHRCKDGSLIDRLREQRGGVQSKESFMGKLSKRVFGSTLKPQDTCIICLGRYGDIMNALPIARDIAHKGGAPVNFMVAAQFADILEGVSYVVPQIFNGNYSRMPEATAQAKAKFKNVVRAQIFGTPEACPETGKPHNRCAWELAGYSKRWTSPKMVLEFDRRNPERERQLLMAHVKRDPRPLLLVAFTCGISGKFNDGRELLSRVVADFGKQFQIVDLATVKAARMYDLLGLYEVAAGMVTIDTGLHHLAAACKRLPVLLLAPDHTYYAAEPRCNCELLIRYGKWREEYSKLAEWVNSKAKPPVFIHTFESHSPLNDRARRAQTTWTVLWEAFSWRYAPHSEPYRRDSREIGDPRGVPYVNDVLEHALKGAPTDAIIVLTNDDVTLLPGVHADLLAHMARTPALACSRREIASFAEASTKPAVQKHTFPGRDLFAFRAWWLRKHLPQIPLLLLGSNEWDNLFLTLIRKECGTLVKGAWNLEMAVTLTDCEMASGNVLHEVHAPFADKPENHNGPHNNWNRIQFAHWAKERCPVVNMPFLEPLYKKWQAGQVKFTPVKKP